jgi:hypothetical protein
MWGAPSPDWRIHEVRFADRPQGKSAPMDRIPASERTRERLKAMMKGRSDAQDETSELVRLIIEEAKDAVSRDYHARSAAPGGYRRYHDAPWRHSGLSIGDGIRNSFKRQAWPGLGTCVGSADRIRVEGDKRLTRCKHAPDIE